MCTYQCTFKAPLLVTSTGCVFSEWEEKMFSAQSWEPCKSTITGDISPAWWAEGRPLGSLSLSFSSLSTVERRTDTHLVPHWEDSKEQSSSKWNAERAQQRAGWPILLLPTFRKLLIAQAGIKSFPELWLTKLNEPCTSNIWLCCVNITQFISWPQLKTRIIWPLELFVRSHQLRYCCTQFTIETMQIR